MNSPECPYCYSGKIIKDKLTGLFICNSCYRQVKIEEINNPTFW